MIARTVAGLAALLAAGCLDVPGFDDRGDPGGEAAPAGGEGEDPPPPGPAVEELANVATGAAIRNAGATWDGGRVATFILSARIAFWDLDGDLADGAPDAQREAEDVLFRDFALSPTLPLLVTASLNSDVQAWDLSREGIPFLG